MCLQISEKLYVWHYRYRAALSPIEVHSHQTGNGTSNKSPQGESKEVKLFVEEVLRRFSSCFVANCFLHNPINLYIFHMETFQSNVHTHFNPGKRQLFRVKHLERHNIDTILSNNFPDMVKSSTLIPFSPFSL